MAKKKDKKAKAKAKDKASKKAKAAKKPVLKVVQDRPFQRNSLDPLSDVAQTSFALLPPRCQICSCGE